MPACSDSGQRLTRDERRRRTEAAILQAAQQLFAEVGFEKATIRGVASRAGVDPALVMQYFGSKEGLFAAAARTFAHRKRALDAPREELARAVLEDLFAAFEDPDAACSSIAVLRSCLTHDSAQRVVRDEVMAERHAKLAAIIGGPEADLRAEVLSAVVLGTTIARYLVQLPALADASPDEVERVLQPVLEAILQG
jgi:AcrR family transcriptional regulator